MALTGPGFSGGGRISGLVSLVDMPPTLLDAAGLPVPPGMEGRSILDGRRGWPEEVFIQISESQVGRAIRTKRWKYGITAPDRNGWQDRDSPIYAEQYLYDLEHDPYEQVNLTGFSSHKEVSGSMRERLLKYLKRVEGQSPSIIEAEEIPSGQRKVYPEEI
jgi:arylsulfatase A-like enzyme